jgi:hypothetical protein
MAFRLNLDTDEVECDSVEDLIAYREARNGRKPRATKVAEGTGDTPPVSVKRRKRRKKRRSTAAKGENTTSRKTSRKKAPTSRNGRGDVGGWAAVKKEAKRQGRTDLAAVRAEMKSAKAT